MSNAFGPKKPLFGPYTYRVKQNSNGDTLIAVYHGSKRIAHIDAFWAYSMRAIEEHEADEARRASGSSGGRGRRLVCATDLRALGAEGKYPNVLAVGHAFMDDDAYKGKGIGRAMYEAMMVEGFAVRQTRIGGQPGPMFFIPDECKGAGNTSAEAQRVWASLARDYPSQGTSIRVDAPPVIGSRAKVNPRRRNPAVFDTLSPGTPNAVREQLQRLSRDDLARLQDELNALDDAAAARLVGMTRLWHGAPASIAERIRERGFARTKGRRSGAFGATYEVDNLAIFLAENKALAEAFGRSRSGRGEGTEVLEVYADLRHPLDMTVWTKVPKPLRVLGEKLLAAHGGSKKPKQEDVFWLIDQPAFIEAVRDLGYDAVRFHESAETVKSLGLARKGEVTVAVLDPARLHVAPPPRGSLGSLLWHLDRSRR